MTKHEAAREIIRQKGGCKEIHCNECPYELAGLHHEEDDTAGPINGPQPALEAWAKNWLENNPEAN